MKFVLLNTKNPDIAFDALWHLQFQGRYDLCDVTIAYLKGFMGRAAETDIDSLRQRVKDALQGGPTGPWLTIRQAADRALSKAMAAG